MPVDAISTFPEGKWVVRWVDMVQPGIAGTGSPGITAQLIRLPEAVAQIPPSRISPDVAENILRYGTVETPVRTESAQYIMKAKDSGGLVACSCLAGSLPRLSVGGVFVDKKKVGSLRLPSRTFEILGPLKIYRPIDAGSRFPHQLYPIMPQAEWWQSVIDRDAYSLRNMISSKCLILPEQDRLLILPCFEVFRTYYGVGTDLANAFLTEPWDFAVGKLAVLPTEQLPTIPGSAVDPPFLDQQHKMTVTLRKKLSAESAMMLAHFLLDPVGKMSAQAVFSATHHETDSTTPGGSIAVGIPFGWDRFQIHVRGINIEHEKHTGAEKFLALQIVGTKWMGPQEIKVIEPKIGKNAAEPNVSTSPKIEAEAQAPPADQASFQAGQDIDAGTASEIEISLAGSRWYDRPNINKKQYEVPLDDKQPIKIKLVTAVVASAGNRNRGLGGLPHLRYEPGTNGEASTRFEAIVKLLNDLKEQEVIEDWESVEPEGDVFFLGKNPVWRLTPDPSTQRLRNPNWVFDIGKYWRTAFVCRFRLEGQVGYWIEIDTRPDKEENFCSLLIDIDDLEPQEIIASLLKHICEHGRRGIWYRSDEKGQGAAGDALPPLAPGIEATQLYRHTKLNDVLLTGGAATKIRRLFKSTIVPD